jgi:hypothetical protein
VKKSAQEKEEDTFLLLPKLYDYGILKEAMDAECYIEHMRTEVLQQHSFVPLALWAGAGARKES